MNLDNLFDDIEAEAFFLEIKREAESKNTAEVIQVLFKAEGIPDLYLYKPVIARDYLAGFKTKSQSRILIPIAQILIIRMPTLNTEILQARSDLVELLETSLFSKEIKFSFSSEVPEIQGQLIGRKQSLVQVISENGLLMFPIQNVSMIAVEKISELL